MEKTSAVQNDCGQEWIRHRQITIEVRQMHSNRGWMNTFACLERKKWTKNMNIHMRNQNSKKMFQCHQKVCGFSSTSCFFHNYRMHASCLYTNHRAYSTALLGIFILSSNFVLANYGFHDVTCRKTDTSMPYHPLANEETRNLQFWRNLLNWLLNLL